MDSFPVPQNYRGFARDVRRLVKVAERVSLGGVFSVTHDPPLVEMPPTSDPLPHGQTQNRSVTLFRGEGGSPSR